VLGEEYLHRACLEGKIREKAPWADESVPGELTELALFIVRESAARLSGQIRAPWPSARALLEKPLNVGSPVLVLLLV
jgi:hypothetical protein